MCLPKTPAGLRTVGKVQGKQHPSSLALSQRCIHLRSPHSRAVLKLRSKSSRTASMKGMVFRYCSGVTFVVPCTQMARSCAGHSVHQASHPLSLARVVRAQHPARRVRGHESFRV